MENNLFIQQGWQCPICGRIYSPTTPMCFYCRPTKVEITTGTPIDHGFPDAYYKNTCTNSPTSITTAKMEKNDWDGSIGVKGY